MRRLISAIIVALFLVTPSYADTPGFSSTTAGGTAADPALPNPNAFFKNIDPELVKTVDNSEISKAFSGILWVIYRVGIIAAVFILTYIALQMILAPPRKKSEVKSALLPYIIGLLLLVAGVPIATMIIEIFIGIF